MSKATILNKAQERVDAIEQTIEELEERLRDALKRTAELEAAAKA